MAYKLHVAAQRGTLDILSIKLLSFQVHMNLQLSEALTSSSAFQQLPKETQVLLNTIMSTPAETVDIGEAVAV